MTIAIDDTVKAFIEGGVSVTIGTCGPDLLPAVARAWGPRVSENGKRIGVCVVAAASGPTLDNLQNNDRAALSFSSPVDYRTLQIKGRVIRTTDAAARDCAAVDEHRGAFAAAAAEIGPSRDFVRSFIERELLASPTLVKIELVPEEIFDQTPGPMAGAPL